MKLTNKHGLPDTIIRAIRKQQQSYSKGSAQRSATQLLNAPQIDVLRMKYYKEMEKDASEEWFALLGHAVHHILEMGAGEGQTAEERLFAEVEGWVISGAMDIQEHNGVREIIDYKVTSTYSITGQDDDFKWEWEAQLNIYDWLVRKNKGHSMDKLTICAILRDWSRKSAENDPLYPQAPIVTISLPVWSAERQEEYVRERVRVHQRAEMDDDFGKPLPECTPKERWERKPSWAFKKKADAKRASRVFYMKEDAEAFHKENPSYIMEERRGENVRCQGDFCQVSRWCHQYAAIRAELEARGT